MTRQLAELETWGETEIRQRGEAMAQVAATIWPGPAAPVRRIDQETKAAPSRFDLRLRYWTGFREHLNAVGSPLAVPEPRPDYSLPLRSPRPQDHLIRLLQSEERANRRGRPLRRQAPAQTFSTPFESTATPSRRRSEPS